MGINVFPIPSSAAVTPTGWTAGVAGTFTLSNTLAVGTYLIKTDSTQSMTIGLIDSNGHNYSGTIRGGSGFITIATAVNQIKIPGSLTYPFGIEITPVSVTQLAAPTSLSLSLSAGGIVTGTWGTAPTGATGATLFTVTGDVVNFSSTASGATATVTPSQVTLNATNQFVVAFKNSSGAYGIGTTYDLAIPAVLPYYFEYLVVGAGGSGSSSGYGTSGGGGGAVKTSTTLGNTSVGSTFAIAVAATPGSGTSGGSSTLTYSSTTITATGGARGVEASAVGANGSSGSGGNSSGSSTVYNGGTGSDGGNGGASVSANPTYSSQGGGGGAGGAASGWSSGNGIASSITGTSIYYAGGGTGGQYSSSGSVGSGGTGRNTSAVANSGAGAGAGGGQGSLNSGGSGVVIVAYPDTAPALTTIPGTLTYSVSTSSRTGYRVYTFTAGSGTVTI
jgi:hypothetical protein